ncbi:magnesium transporter [Thioalkalicoccus limnaeus]|uniref:Magnesium transporter n=1 Tax=Thioalkalicoccus limnaeus TaxID=120681 RepID=A0ABV4B8Z8_9GAMM
MANDAGLSAEPINFEIAAAHATSRVPIASPASLVADVRAELMGGDFDTANLVVVEDQGLFRGIVRLEALLAAPPRQLIGDLMDREPPVVAPGVDQEVAAWRAVRHREAALVLVDASGRFQGVIPPDRLLAILLAEHDEDLTRIGGFMKDTAAVRTASLEPVPRRFRHRLPWLLVGLAGAFVAAGFVARFEEQLQQMLILVFFIPGIVYLADAVGTQTETVVVRGLSVGVPLRRMVARELAAGLAIGLALGMTAGPLVYLLWHDLDVALIVALSVSAACSTATLVAMLLPWLLSMSGRDPAFGSGPLATVVQDLLSILIYFGIATALM